MRELRSASLLLALLVPLLLPSCRSSEPSGKDYISAAGHLARADSLERRDLYSQAMLEYLLVAQMYPSSREHPQAVLKTALLYSNPRNPALNDSLASHWFEVYRDRYADTDEAESLTPRQRIVVSRELARLAPQRTSAARRLRASLRADFDYQGIATCAGDSMCETSCPVKIDTGALIKELRSARHPRWARILAGTAASNLGMVMRLARLGLGMVARVRRVAGGPQLIHASTALIHRLAPTLIPVVAPHLELPGPAVPLPVPAARKAAPRVVYFPSCLTRILGSMPGETTPAPAMAMLEVLELAGFEAVYPEGLTSLCCGMPFLSKGFPEAARAVAARKAESLWSASRQGRDPELTDASPCAGTLGDLVATHLRRTGRALRALDFVSFWAREALPRLAKKDNDTRSTRSIFFP